MPLLASRRAVPGPFREERSAERFALRAAFGAIGSFDGGVEEFPEFIPRRRRSSAFSASSAPTRSAKTATRPASSSYEGDGEGWASAGTTTMIDDQGRKIKSDTPPRTCHAQPASIAQLNRPREWTRPDGGARNMPSWFGMAPEKFAKPARKVAVEIVMMNLDGWQQRCRG
jgi:hypothetical protein